MSIRFPTEAANADRMDDTPRTDEDAAPDARGDEATPGKGINQAGFVKDRDAVRGKDPSKPTKDA